MFEELNARINRIATGAAASAVSSGSKLAFGWFSVPISSLILSLMSEYDHNLEKERILRLFAPEIRAKTGKDRLEVEDLEKIAETNDILKDALSRSKRKRNLSVAVNIAATVIAFGLALYLGGPLASFLNITGTGTAIAEAICHGVVGFVGFMASEKLLNDSGKAAFGLNEPEIKFVEKDPSLQPTLSIASQVNYIAKLQQKRIKISQAEVLGVFIAANSQEIDKNRRDEVYIEQLAQKYNIEEVTNLLNNGQIRAQELAFLAVGQKSGVEPLDAPRKTMLEQTNQVLAQKLEAAHERIGELTDKTKEFASSVKENAVAVKENMGEKFSYLRERMPFNPKKIIEEREGNNPISPEAIAESRSKPSGEMSPV